MHMTRDLLDPNPTNTTDFHMMVSRSYSTKNTWYDEYEVTGPPEQKKKYAGEVIQIPADIDITKPREERILQAIAESYSVTHSNPEKQTTRKLLEVFVHETRSSETV